MKTLFILAFTLLFISCSKKDYSTVSGKIVVDGELNKTGKITLRKYWWADTSEKQIFDINKDGTFKVDLKENDYYLLVFSYPDHQPIMFELDVPVHKDFEIEVNFKRHYKSNKYYVSYRLPNAKRFRQKELKKIGSSYELELEFPDSVTSIEYQIKDVNTPIHIDGDKFDFFGYGIMNKEVINNQVKFEFSDNALKEKQEFTSIISKKNANYYSTISNLISTYFAIQKTLRDEKTINDHRVKSFFNSFDKVYKSLTGDLKKEYLLVAYTIGIKRLTDAYDEDYENTISYAKSNKQFAYTSYSSHWRINEEFRDEKTSLEELYNAVDSIMNHSSISVGRYIQYYTTKYDLLFQMGKYSDALALVDTVKHKYPNSLYTNRLIGMSKSINLVGSTAPNFTLLDENNEQVSLSDYNGKYVFLDFWATWCSPCIKAMPHIRTAYDKLNQENIEFISVCLDSKDRDLVELNKKYNMNWVTLGAEDSLKSDIKKKYKIELLPTTFLIDPSGKIIAKDGDLSSDNLYDFIRTKIN